MSKIKYKLVGDEPVCPGGDMGCGAQCMAVVDGKISYMPEGMTCVPGIRQQRDVLRGENHLLASINKNLTAENGRLKKIIERLTSEARSKQR